jgi:hypothetical protein
MLGKTETIYTLWGKTKEKGRWGETRGDIKPRDRIEVR